MDPLNLSVSHLAHDIANKTITSEDYCLRLIDKVESENNLNVYATFDKDLLLDAARESDRDLKTGSVRGPLHGVPLIIKDNINTSDLATRGGTPALKDNLPGSDAPIVSKLRRAGAFVAGKANLHELSSGGTSANHTFGPVRNPFDRTCVPGGSSGGTAAAIAARLAPAGLGTDTAGSVRVPASLCGVFGYRPTVGRYSAAGIVPLSTSLDTAGPLARTIDDIILLDGVLADQSNSVRERDLGTVCLGVAENIMADATPEAAATIQQTLNALEKAGVALKAVDLSPLRPLQTDAGKDVIDFEFEHAMRDYLTEFAPDITLDAVVEQIASPAAKAFTEERLEKTFDRAVYDFALNEGLRNFNVAWRALFDDHAIDAVAFPTTPGVALPLADDDHVIKNSDSTFSWFYFRYTSMASVGRRPGLSIPAYLNGDGLPVGLELDGLPGEDEALMSTARAVASVLDPLPPPPG